MASERRRDLPPDYAPPRRVSHEEYRRLDEQLPGKYEYHNGWMYPRFYPPGSHWAMAGGTAAHAQIIVRVLFALTDHLGFYGPCRVFPSDMQLKAGTHEYYPDAYVTCDDPIRPDQTRLEDAVVVCEVRSQSTADFDKGDKFEAYKLLPSLREYLILDNRRPQATLFQKGDDGVWRYLVIAEGGDVVLETIGLTAPLQQFYVGVTLDPDPTGEEL
jgi:Uma2 family endonuclease